MIILSDKIKEETVSVLAARLMRKYYITNNNKITPLPTIPEYSIDMDQVSFNIEKLPFQNLTSKASRADILLSTVDSKLVTSWQEILSSSTPLRVMIGGKRSHGKTTMLRKITYDWSTQNTSALNLYKLVLYIDLGLVKTWEPYTSLSECIIEQCCKLNNIFTHKKDTIDQTK